VLCGQCDNVLRGQCDNVLCGQCDNVLRGQCCHTAEGAVICEHGKNAGLVNRRRKLNRPGENKPSSGAHLFTMNPAQSDATFNCSCGNVAHDIHQCSGGARWASSAGFGGTG
jgi:hypothetical protein